jgi:hypothetical protein
VISEMAARRQNRLTLRGLSDYHYKWARLWSYAKNRSLSRLIVDVFETQVEANKAEIEMMIRDIAEQRGIAFEDLVAEIMASGDEEN